MNKKIIRIGNDHGGYEMKLQLIEHLIKIGYEVNDVGSHSTKKVKYPYYAQKVAIAVS